MANAATTVRITIRIFGIDQHICLGDVFNLSSIVIDILHLFWLIFVDVFDHSPVEFGNRQWDRVRLQSSRIDLQGTKKTNLVMSTCCMKPQ